MYKVATISLFIVFTSSLFCFGKCDEILGCGGFVKSDVAIDFSQIEVCKSLFYVTTKIVALGI